MSEAPETRYVRVGDYNLAYQVVGDGPTDIVLHRNVFNHLEEQWEQPRMAAFLRRLASFSRLIMYDTRGGGLSDPFTGGEPELDEWSDDVLGILDVTGSSRPAYVSILSASLRALLFAATHPDRVEALVVCHGMACFMASADYPFGVTEQELDTLVEHVSRTWGTADEIREELPPDLADWIARYERLSVSRGQAAALMRYTPRLDVRHVLHTIRVPTLILTHSESGARTGPPAGRYLAERIPNATYVELPGRPLHTWIFPDPEAVADEIQQFLTGVRGTPEPTRVLATLLFTDVVESTKKASQVGDRRWNDVLDALDALVARQVERFGGTIVDRVGDGHLATFDAPGRGIRCARALSEAAQRLDLTLRAGLHTGEVELRRDGIGGIAVHIGRRVCDLARPNELLVSSSIPPLVTGSDLEFVDRGEHELKGVPSRWQLYAVKS